MLLTVSALTDLASWVVFNPLVSIGELIVAGMLFLLVFIVAGAMAAAQVALWVAWQRLRASQPRLMAILAILGRQCGDLAFPALLLFFGAATVLYLVVVLDPADVNAGGELLVAGVAFLLLIVAMSAQAVCSWMRAGALNAEAAA